MAARFEALERLRNKIMESHHDYRVGTDIFPSLDVEKVARDMNLVEVGTIRGKSNEPLKNAKGFDEIELSIVEKIQDEKKAAHQVLEDQLHLYSRRIANLDFYEQFGMLQQANASSLSDFKAEIAVGLDVLHAKRTDLHEATQELKGFREDHKLKRVARLQEGVSYYFKISLLVVVFCLEIFMNGVFLAKGNDQGVVGGTTEAIAFSFINIGSALIIAIFCVRLVTHRSWFAKFLGIASIILYIAIAIFINLLLAHYREASGTLADGAARTAIRSLFSEPLGLAEVSSWMLFLVGLLFSIIAFIDGWFVLDPYPGYSGVQKRHRGRRQDYTETKSSLIDTLTDTRDKHNESVEEILKGLSARRREHAAILTSRARLLNLYVEHENQLERVCNQLLSKYREANARTRAEPTPKHFAQPYKMQRSTLETRADSDVKESELAGSIARAQQALNDQMILIGKECEAGIEKYRDLDKLYPDQVDV